MTDPNLNVPVPQPVLNTAKAVAATVTTGLGVLALFISSIGDGSISWDEGGKLLGAVVAAAATVGAVWRTENKPKQERR